MRIPQDIQDKAVKLYLNGASSYEVGEVLGIGHSSVFNILKKSGTNSRSTGSHLRKYCFNESFFEKIDTEEKAYWLGFLFADGYVKDNLFGLDLSESDEPHIFKLKKHIQSSHPIKKKSYKKYKCSYFRIYSKKLCDQLKKLGCHERKSLTLEFPDYNSVPTHLMNHFMRGYFDGDGSLSGKCFGVVSSFNFSKKYLEILNQHTGLAKTTLTKHSISNVFYLTYSGNFNLTKIRNFLYKDATLFLERKKEKFDLIKETNFLSKKDEHKYLIVKAISNKNGELTSRDLSKELDLNFERVRFVLKSLVKEKKISWKRLGKSNRNIKYFIHE